VTQKIHWIAKFSITVLIGLFMFLNILPWIAAAQGLAANIPALSKALADFYSIPVLGWALKFVIDNLAVLIGVILWLTVQTIQILPTLIERPVTLYPLIQAWDGAGFPTTGDKSSKMDGLKRRFNDALVQIIDNLKFYRAIAYCIEALVCLYVYPPYIGGWLKLIDDYPIFDWDSISFPNIISAIVTMFAFEFLFRIALNLWGLTEIITLGGKLKANRQSEPAATPNQPS
jgi:hypothetical protein